jgi:photosystem II stability/assembly factor-like uncharacterized protein
VDLESPTQGWALTADRLALTRDSGASWTNITPTGVGAGDVRAVQFVDLNNALTLNAGATPTLAKTADAGKTWIQVALPFVPASPSMSFSDPLHGAVLNTVSQNANSSKADLYVTTDGGVNWTKVVAPGAGIAKAAASGIWVASRDKLFRTTDSGQTWKAVTVPAPPQWSSAIPAYDVPRLFDATTAVLVVSFTNVDAAGIGFYVTRDGGSTWQGPFASAVGDGLGAFVRVPITVVDAQTWLAVEPSGRHAISAQNGGSSVQTRATTGLPQGVFKLSASGGTVWALVHTQNCTGPKDTLICSDSWQLLRSTDSGSNWSRLSP